MNKTYLLKNGLIITGDGSSFQGHVLFNREIQLVTDTMPAVPAGVKEIDCSGLIVRPGGIDIHTHFDLIISPGLRTIESISSGTYGALKGGITMVGDFATQVHGQSLIDCYEQRLKQMKEDSKCKYYLHLAVTDWKQDSYDQIAYLMKKYGLQSIKLFTTYKERGYDSNYALIHEALRKSRDMNYLVMIHCEHNDIIEYHQNRMRQDDTMKEMEKFKYSRPSLAEALAVNNVCYLNSRAGGNLYIVHASTPEAVRLISQYRADNTEAKFYAESCPQYFLLDDRVFLKENGHLFTSQPQLKSSEEKKELYRMVLQGDIDILATDNCAFSRKDKVAGLKEGFAKIPAGIPGTQFLLPITFSALVQQGGLSPEQWVNMTSSRQAEIFHIKDTGLIRKGLSADITVFDPDIQWEITEQDLESGADWSPYTGMKIRGKVQATFLSGKLCFSEERFQQGAAN